MMADQRTRWCILLGTLGLAYFGAWADGAARAEHLRLQGSSAFAHDMIEPYHAQIEAGTGHTLEITASTSGEGLIALLEGKADLAMIWAPLDGIVAELQPLHPNLPFHRLREFRVAKAPIAYSVNPANPVRFVPLPKLKQILSGKIDNWRAVGGPDLPIHVVSMHNGGGAKRTTEALVMDGEPMHPRSDIEVANSAEVVDVVARDRAALGISRASLVADRVPRLRTSIAVGQAFSLITLDAPTDAMRDVIVATRSILFGEVP